MGFRQVLQFQVTVQKPAHLVDLESLNTAGCEPIFAQSCDMYTLKVTFKALNYFPSCCATFKCIPSKNVHN